MSVVPPENTDRLEHQRQHDAELRHDKEMLEHREHAHPVDEKGQATHDLAPASPSEPSSETPDYMTRTVWTFKTFVATVALSGLYVGSQIPLYFVGGSLSFIAKDIGGAEASAWLAVSYALALSAVAPFCGYLQDLVGRRNITLGGGVSLMMGCIILATAHTFGQGVVGMSFAGAGAAIGELTALAGYICFLTSKESKVDNRCLGRPNSSLSTSEVYISLSLHYLCYPLHLTCCTLSFCQPIIPGDGASGFACKFKDPHQSQFLSLMHNAESGMPFGGSLSLRYISPNPRSVPRGRLQRQF